MGRATWQTNRGVVWYALVVSHVRLFLVTCLALTGLAVPGAVGAHVAVTQPLLAPWHRPRSRQ